LDPANPAATAVAIRAGRFAAVGSDKEISALAGTATKVIDLRKRAILPGLIDNHLHAIRGGLNFNMELRWDGVRSLALAMGMFRRRVAVTPPPPVRKLAEEEALAVRLAYNLFTQRPRAEKER